MTFEAVNSAAPAQGGFTIAPNDNAPLARSCRSIWVAGEGNVRILSPDGDDVTYQGVPSGSVLPAAARKVFSTGTTATGLVAMT